MNKPKKGKRTLVDWLPWILGGVTVAAMVGLAIYDVSSDSKRLEATATAPSASAPESPPDPAVVRRAPEAPTESIPPWEVASGTPVPPHHEPAWVVRPPGPNPDEVPPPPPQEPPDPLTHEPPKDNPGGVNGDRPPRPVPGIDPEAEPAPPPE